MTDTDEEDIRVPSTAADAVAKSDSKKRKKKKKKAKDKDVTPLENTLVIAKAMDEPSDKKKNDSLEVNNENVEQKKSKKSKKKKKKKETKKESSNSSSTEKNESPKSENANGDRNDEGDDSDDELLAAAAMWAGDEEGDNAEEESSVRATSQQSISQPQNLSLHITQLPYDSTEFDLRKLFAEQGCSITSIRLVYDHDTEGRKTVFRGVAFCDFLDVTSYQNALKLHHKSSIRGRKLNIRPCKSKEELAAIVARTQDLVREKIHQQLSGKNITASSSPSTKASNKPSSKGKQSGSKRKNSDRKDRNNKKARLDKDGKPVKLTKKERNRRAAIIMQKRRRQMK